MTKLGVMSATFEHVVHPRYSPHDARHVKLDVKYMACMNAFEVADKFT